MSKKKVKGTKIDLSTLGVSGPLGAPALPKGPAERAENDEGRFRRNFGDRDRDRDGGKGGKGDGHGRSDVDSNWGRSSGGGGSGGFGGGGSSGGFGGGGSGMGAGWRGGGVAPSGGGMFGRAPASGGQAAGGGDKWSKLEGKLEGMGGDARGGDVRGGGFGRDQGPPPAAATGSRFGFVNSEPREAPPRAPQESMLGGRPPMGMGGGGYAAAAAQPGRNFGSAPAGGAAVQLVTGKLDAEAAEAAKKAEKAARAAKKNEEKAAAKAAEEEAKAAAKAAKAAVKAAEAAVAAQAAALVATGKKGAELAAAAAALGGDAPSPKAVCAAVLASLPKADATSTGWCEDGEYGLCLKALSGGKGGTDKATGILYACQAHYHALGFPKAEPAKEGEKKKSLFQTLLFKLYDAEVVEEVTVNAWRYSDSDEKEAPGKTDALIQLTDFLAWMDEPAAEEEDDEGNEVTLAPSLDKPAAAIKYVSLK